MKNSVIESSKEDILTVLNDAFSMIMARREGASGWPAFACNPIFQDRLWHFSALPEQGKPIIESVTQFFTLLDNGYCNVSHPLYLGYISPKPLLESIVGDFIASALNQTPGAQRAGPVATHIELEVIAWLREFIGLPAVPPGHVGGIFTSGGSMANLTALKLARDIHYPYCIDQGLPVGEKPTIYVSEEGHFSLIKSVDMLGLGRRVLRKIETDEQGKIKTDVLNRVVEDDVIKGYTPICIVGIAGTSATGAIDPLNTLADISKSYDCWFHVDGAAGVAMAALDTHTDDFLGIARADSVSLDPCKWMFMAFGVGCLFVNNDKELRNSFDVIGHYWEDLDELDFFRMSFNGTRQWRSLGLWFAMKSLGTHGYRQLLTRLNSRALLFNSMLRKSGKFEVLMDSRLPVCCFRAAGSERLTPNKATKLLHKAVNQSGQAYLTLIEWNGKNYLRAGFNNYSTTAKEVLELVKFFEHCLIELMDS